MNSAPKAQQSGQIVYRPWSILSVPSKNIKFHRSLPTKPPSKRDLHRVAVLQSHKSTVSQSHSLSAKQQHNIAVRFGLSREERIAIAEQTSKSPEYFINHFWHPRSDRARQLSILKASN